MLGELWSYAEMARCVVHAAELGRRKANLYPLLNQVLAGEGTPA